MKELIRQFYNEGFATTFIKKPTNYIKKHTKNKNTVKIFSILIKIFYTLLVLAFATYMFIKKIGL